MKKFLKVTILFLSIVGITHTAVSDDSEPVARVESQNDELGARMLAVGLEAAKGVENSFFEDFKKLSVEQRNFVLNYSNSKDTNKNKLIHYLSWYGNAELLRVIIPYYENGLIDARSVKANNGKMLYQLLQEKGCKEGLSGAPCVAQRNEALKVCNDFQKELNNMAGKLLSEADNAASQSADKEKFSDPAAENRRRIDDFIQKFKALPTRTASFVLNYSKPEDTQKRTIIHGFAWYGNVELLNLIIPYYNGGLDTAIAHKKADGANLFDLIAIRGCKSGWAEKSLDCALEAQKVFDSIVAADKSAQKRD